MAQDRNRDSGSRRDSGGKEQRGFASMDKEKQREIARKGGEHSHDNDSTSRDSGGRSGKR